MSDPRRRRRYENMTRERESDRRTAEHGLFVYFIVPSGERINNDQFFICFFFYVCTRKKFYRNENGRHTVIPCFGRQIAFNLRFVFIHRERGDF